MDHSVQSTGKTHGACTRPVRLDRESAQWLASLGASSVVRDAALSRLHSILLRVARREGARRSAGSLFSATELDDLTQQATDDALLAVTRKLETFRGESRFTTWACKFVVLEVSSKLARHTWRSVQPGLRQDRDDLTGGPASDPHQAAEWSELFAAMRRIVDEQLTAHQRRVFVALTLRDVPLDALAEQLGASRNAVYKTLFDARSKVRAELATDGYLDHRELRNSSSLRS